MPSPRVGREDLLKAMLALLLWGRAPRNPGVIELELAACQVLIDQVRRGERTCLDFLRDFTRNQDSLWMAICVLLDLPGAWDVFRFIAAKEIQVGTGEGEGTSTYGAWRLTGWYGAMIAAQRQGRPVAYALARELARRHGALFALGCGIGPEGSPIYHLAGPRMHPTNLQKGQRQLIIARIGGLKLPAFGPNFRELSYGSALPDIALDHLQGGGLVYSEDERLGIRRWVADREITPAFRGIISGISLAVPVSLFVGDRGGVDTVCPKMAPCDDPLPGSVMLQGQSPRELRWATMRDPNPGSLGYNPLWTGGETRCEYDGETMRASLAGRTLTEDSHASLAEIACHGQRPMHTIIIREDGVLLDGAKLSASALSIDGIELHDGAGGDIAPYPKPKPSNRVPLERVKARLGEAFRAVEDARLEVEESQGWLGTWTTMAAKSCETAIEKLTTTIMLLRGDLP